MAVRYAVAICLVLLAMSILYILLLKIKFSEMSLVVWSALASLLNSVIVDQCWRLIS